MQYIEIKTERLFLRPLGTGDLDAACAFALDPENTKYMCYFPKADRAETLRWLQDIENEWSREEPAFLEFAVLSDGRVIGAVSLYYEQDFAELAWIIHRAYWGNGYAFEAAKAMMEYFRDHFGTAYFVACCDTENTASRRVMEKLGMVKTGEQGGRRNRAAVRDSFEYRYELRFAL